jgi:pyruvate dehydrogenase kinase 2/3/4
MLKRLLCIREYANKNVTPLKLKYIYDFGNQNKMKEQGNYLHSELPIRLAKRTIELEKLPEEIIKLETFQEIHELYINSFEKILNHPKPNSFLELESFTALLGDIKYKHSNIESHVSNSITNYKFDNYIKYTDDCKIIDDVLNNFYMSRIGIRFLIGQHLDTFNNNNTERYVGIIDKKCNPYNLILNSINKIKSMFILSDIDNIEFNIQGNNNIEFMYIPSHLEYIFFEILKNAVKAIIDDNFKNPKINIFIEKGKQDILIKISDRGMGIQRDMSDYIFSYLYTSTLSVNMDQPILSGFGHGLGLSKLYSQYLGGDLKIISSEGIGTDAYIHIKTINIDENIN